MLSIGNIHVMRRRWILHSHFGRLAFHLIHISWCSYRTQLSSIIKSQDCVSLHGNYVHAWQICYAHLMDLPSIGVSKRQWIAAPPSLSHVCSRMWSINHCWKKGPNVDEACQSSSASLKEKRREVSLVSLPCARYPVGVSYPNWI